MDDYYATRLNARRLWQVYETSIERVRRYLRAEILFVERGLSGTERVLELGCGYGRIMKEIAPHASSVLGIDLSPASVAMGKAYLKERQNCEIRTMDARDLRLEQEFDLVLCLQNGLSAIRGGAQDLVERSLGVLAAGGRAVFSTYSERFWEHRLAWFVEQADKGLIGEIDFERTGNGVVACKDGFVSRSFSPEELESLARRTGRRYRIEEIDDSCLFLVIEANDGGRRSEKVQAEGSDER